MSKSIPDQLLDMLETIDETKNFLRKRCASGQAGQSMSLFEDLASLLELLDDRYRKSGYLPREKVPILGSNADILSAVRFLDALDLWSAKTRDKVKRIKMRQELARGSIIEVAVKQGKPFAQQAAEMVQFARTGSPEERATQENGINVAFSQESVAKARAAYGAAVKPETQPAQEESIAAEPTPSSLESDILESSKIDTENARLFAGIRARTGVQAPNTKISSEETAPPGQVLENSPANEKNIKSKRILAHPVDTKLADSQKRESHSIGPRPMRARNSQPISEESKIGKSEEAEFPKSGAKPMRVRNQASPTSREEPVSARESSPNARGAKPMAPKGSEVQPMKAKSQKTQLPVPEQPAAMGTTTGPAVGRGVLIDRDFLRIVNEVRNMSEKELEKKIVEAFPKLENRYKMVICDQFRKFGYWGKLEPDRNEYEALRLRAKELSQHMDEYSWLYGKLGDYRSRKTLLALLDNWYSYNFKELANMKEKMFPSYLDADLLRCTETEVFVDLGAGTGEVTMSFAKYAGHWKKIYCYEPHPGNFSTLQSQTKDLGLIELKPYAVGDRPGKGYLETFDDPLLSKIGISGAEVDIVRLDDDIKEPISILKMCLEGGEQPAIRGCSNRIHQDHPKLILRADHGESDLWQLPRMIERLDKKYRFYLRHYGGNLAPMEYMLYAV